MAIRLPAFVVLPSPYRWMSPKPPAAAAASARRLAREHAQEDRAWNAARGGLDPTWGERRRAARIGWGLRLPLPGQPAAPEGGADSGAAVPPSSCSMR